MLVRIFLKLEPPWTEVASMDGELLAFTRDGVRLYSTALYDRFAPRPPEPGVEITAQTLVRSALGWPVVIIERAVGSRRELDVRYEIFELSGSVVASGPADSIARLRDELLAAALGGRPDFGDRIACVAQVFLGAA